MRALILFCVLATSLAAHLRNTHLAQQFVDDNLDLNQYGNEADTDTFRFLPVRLP